MSSDNFVKIERLSADLADLLKWKDAPQRARSHTLRAIRTDLSLLIKSVEAEK
jgi:hypothetical protein